MGEITFGRKISWFLYQKGIGIARPDYLFIAKIGGPEWVRVAETLFKDNHLEGRGLVLDQVLQSRHFQNHPKRNLYLRLLGQYLSKGIIDERRRIARYIDDNPGFFNATDDAIMGPLITAQRDKDQITAVTAESALLKIRGEVKVERKDFRD